MNTYGQFLSRLWRGMVILAVLLGGVATPSPTVASPSVGTISVKPASGAPGSWAMVEGSFPTFGAFDFVVLWWDYLYDGEQLGSVSLRDDGSFNFPIAVPPDAFSGTHKIIADVNYGYEQAEVEFEVKEQIQHSAAYIYDNDEKLATEYKTLLDSYGVQTDLVPIASVVETSFSGYDLVLVGPDTGSLSTWGTPEAVTRLLRSGKPILGLGQGGYAFFGKLQLNIGYAKGAHGSEYQLSVVDPEHPVFNLPYHVSPASGATLDIYQEPVSTVVIYRPTAIPEVALLGRDSSSQIYYPLVQEDGRYLLWGFAGSPSGLTWAGEHLLINTIYHLIWIFDVDTLILTDYDRMKELGYTTADVNDLENDINNLRGLPESTTNMDAIWRDLSDHSPGDVPTDCTAWDADEGDVADTNTCVEAIDDYIENLKASTYPNLYYVMIVGTSEVIPMKAREQDHLISAQEDSWGAALPTSGYIQDLYSDSGSNGWGHYLTDTIYGDLSYINDGWGTDRELIPELAVGRVVETPTQISDQIDVFINASAYFSRADRVSIASSDYVDGGTLAADNMDPGTDDSLVQSSFPSTDVPPELNAGNDLVYFGGHGDYNAISTGSSSFMAGNHATRGDTNDLNDMPNAVIVTSGCHNGVSFGNQLFHAPDTTTTYSEFPEEFGDLQAGVYVGATGFTIISGTGSSTDVSQVRHNEKLSTYVIQHLDQDGCISAGEAFRRAVNSYVTDVGSIGTMERRVIAITTLYGIPNYRGSCWYVLIPRFYEYLLRPIWVDPPPVFDPGIFRLRFEFELLDWEIRFPEGGPEWYLHFDGASYGGAYNEPLIPLIKSQVVLPPGSTIEGVVWDQGASQSTGWTSDGGLYIPPTKEDPWPLGTSTQLEPGPFTYPSLFPDLPYTTYTSTTTGGLGTQAGLGITPLQHDPNTMDNTLWTQMAFTVTLQTSGASDADGDGLPTYWEGSHGLDPNDGVGDNGALGDPDDDGLNNTGELERGTSPVDPDTDDDGWGDGDEIEWGTDPLNPGSHPWPLHLPLIVGQ